MAAAKTESELAALQFSAVGRWELSDRARIVAQSLRRAAAGKLAEQGRGRPADAWPLSPSARQSVCDEVFAGILVTDGYTGEEPTVAVAGDGMNSGRSFGKERRERIAAARRQLVVAPAFAAAIGALRAAGHLWRIDVGDAHAVAVAGSQGIAVMDGAHAKGCC